MFSQKTQKTQKLFTLLQYHINRNGSRNDCHFRPVFGYALLDVDNVLIGRRKRLPGEAVPFFGNRTNYFAGGIGDGKIPRFPIALYFSDLHLLMIVYQKPGLEETEFLFDEPDGTIIGIGNGNFRHEKRPAAVDCRQYLPVRILDFERKRHHFLDIADDPQELVKPGYPLLYETDLLTGVVKHFVGIGELEKADFLVDQKGILKKKLGKYRLTHWVWKLAKRRNMPSFQ